MAKTDVIKQVAALPGMTTTRLKEMWQELFDADPPPYAKQFLVKRLAYRLQELAYGGLSKQTEERLKTLARDETQIGRNQPKGDGRPVVGTRLIREWKGIDYCVTVLADGFEYQGRPFRSLSAVARAITGTRWNGWTFFGVRRHGNGGDQ
ncbi:MAG: DUF2924 domain-containing protein [Magnetococcales bacterium]|nr:DUF2924 domain-containing protein [Magnetococcales bacterium]